MVNMAKDGRYWINWTLSQGKMIRICFIEYGDLTTKVYIEVPTLSYTECQAGLNWDTPDKPNCAQQEHLC